LSLWVIGTTWFSWLEKISSIGSHFVKITQYVRHPFAVRSYPCLTFGSWTGNQSRFISNHDYNDP
jgi:hypothetical protein